MNSKSKIYQQLVLKRVEVHSKRGTDPIIALKELRMMLEFQAMADLATCALSSEENETDVACIARDTVG